MGGGSQMPLGGASPVGGGMGPLMTDTEAPAPPQMPADDLNIGDVLDILSSSSTCSLDSLLSSAGAGFSVAGGTMGSGNMASPVTQVSWSRGTGGIVPQTSTTTSLHQQRQQQALLMQNQQQHGIAGLGGRVASPGFAGQRSPSNIMARQSPGFTPSPGLLAAQRNTTLSQSPHQISLQPHQSGGGLVSGLCHHIL